MKFEIPDSVKLINPAPVDYYYGPWADLATAKTNVPLAVRTLGLKVYITSLHETYVWRSGLTDSDLVVDLEQLDSVPTESSANGVESGGVFDALALKVDKVTGKQLSTNDYTSAEQTKLANLSEHYVGYYVSLSSLQSAHPTGLAGQYATVDSGTGSDAKQYIWDTNDSAWILGSGSGAVTSVNSQTGAVSLSTDNIGEGSTNKYFTVARVLATVLTGIGFSTITAVLATDTILQAIGKLQGQITALLKIPTGGTTGQMLVKVDNTDGNTHWIDAPTGGVAGPTGPQGATGAAGTVFIIPEDVPSLRFSDYDTGVAGTTDGQIFGVVSTNLQTIRVYKNVSGAGVYQFTKEWTALVDYDFIRKSIFHKIAGKIPGYPVVDFDSHSIFQSTNKIINLATGIVPDESVTTAGLSLGVANGAVLTPGAPDKFSGTSGFQIDFPADSSIGSWVAFVYLVNNITWTATGEWTLAYDIRLPDGSANHDVSFCNVGGAGAGLNPGSPRVTLTTAWQTIKYTTVYDGNMRILFSPYYPLVIADQETTPTVAFTAYICNLRIVAGNATTDAIPTGQSDLELSVSRIADASDGMFLDSNQHRLLGRADTVVRFPSPVVFNAFTVAAAIKLTTASYYDFFITYNNGADYLGLQNGSFIGDNKLININSGGSVPINQWLIIVATSDKHGCDVYINNIRIAFNQTAIIPQTISNINLFGQPGGFMNGSISSLGVWKSRLSKSQVNTVTNTYISRILAKGGSYFDIDTYWIIEGDSISSNGGYSVDIQSHFTPTLQSTNYAANGKSLGAPGDSGANTVFSGQSQVYGDISGQTGAGRNVIFSLFIGANGVPSMTSTAEADTWYANWCIYILGAKAAGANTIACTILDNSNISDKTYINYVNGLIRGDTSKYDALCDFNANTSLTPATPTYFSDGQHPNSAGQAIMTTIMLPCIEEFWVE